MNWDLVVIFTFVIVLTIVRARYGLGKRSGNLTAGDNAVLTTAMDTAKRLEQRIETLERLLDEDAPGWRARVRA